MSRASALLLGITTNGKQSCIINTRFAGRRRRVDLKNVIIQTTSYYDFMLMNILWNIIPWNILVRDISKLMGARCEIS